MRLEYKSENFNEWHVGEPFLWVANSASGQLVEEQC